MKIELKQHIELEGINPLDAIVDGHPRVKAYLVASLAIKDGVEAAIEQYKDFDLSVAAVHAALTFHYDNQEAIRKADAEAMEHIRAMGGRDAREVREEIMRRQQK
jgi:predicted class III extradiol MEMO1 family dioxygenase